jgi:hypothetical protein
MMRVQQNKYEETNMKTYLVLFAIFMGSIGHASQDCTASIKKISAKSGHPVVIATYKIDGPDAIGNTSYKVDFGIDDPFNMESIVMFLDQNCDLISDGDIQYWHR